MRVIPAYAGMIVIADLSVNEKFREIEFAAVEMLDDPRTNHIMVVSNGKATICEK